MTRNRISIRRPDSQPLTPAEILRTVGSSECAPVESTPDGYSRAEIVGAALFIGAVAVAVVFAVTR